MGKAKGKAEGLSGSGLKRGDGGVSVRGARAGSSLVPQRHDTLCFDRSSLRRDSQNAWGTGFRFYSGERTAMIPSGA